MRKACRVALLLMTASAAAAGERYGPIFIDQAPALGNARPGGYHEYRFTIRNESAQQHSVRMDIKSMMVFRTPGENHTARQFIIRPRSSELVSIPQYIGGPGYGMTEAVVTIDGREQREHLEISRVAASDWGNRPEVLIGRDVPQAIVTALLPDPSHGVAIRADVPPRDWSDQWIQYGRYEGALMTPLDWSEMPAAVRNALLHWVAAGGALIFFGAPQQLPLLRAAPDVRQFWAGHHGFGTIAVLGNEPALEEATITELRGLWRRGSGTPQDLGEMNTTMPILDKTAIPVGSMFSLLILFAVAGGPASLIALARKDKRVWIFATLPLLAIITAGVVVGALIVHEGWARIQKTTSLTVLDERSGEAATIGWTGFYTTFPPNGEVRFDYDSEVRPFAYTKDARTDWTDGQRFVSGWIGSRVPSHFAIRKAEARRERVPIRVDGGRVFALNGLGVAITDLQVVLGDAVVYEAKNIPAGKQVMLTNTGKRVYRASKDPAELFGPVAMWHSFYSRVTNEPPEYLQPGTYVAVLEKSPFVEQALEHPSRVVSQSVVIGYIKRSANAG